MSRLLLIDGSPTPRCKSLGLRTFYVVPHCPRLQSKSALEIVSPLPADHRQLESMESMPSPCSLAHQDHIWRESTELASHHAYTLGTAHFVAHNPNEQCSRCLTVLPTTWSTIGLTTSLHISSLKHEYHRQQLALGLPKRRHLQNLSCYFAGKSLYHPSPMRGRQHKPPTYEMVCTTPWTF
jgi:hypothetical protein